MPIIVISGSMTFGGADIESLARDLGADALLAKPFRASALAQKLRELLAR